SIIERGQVDEAIAHCRHILQTFPKHLDTYRLLGKAYLESKRYPDATDIFNRVLMAVPDDFVSHVGLSIIADDQKRLEDAIWHMERAFERQPSNAAIHAELQRLYGRRDGREPPKIRLTRGALAQMYYQGDLYVQAISEARSVLSEDPSRIDLKPLLALAYFRAGQKVEASEICTQLISEFPYCLEANRVLIEILPGTGMAESANAYRQRVIELDPYAAHARASIFQTSDAPDLAVTVERLDYQGQPVETGAEWGKSLGIGTVAAAASSEQPDWMKSNYQAESTPHFETPPAASFDFAQDTVETAASTPSEREPFDESPASAEKDDIPEWMRQAGWGTSTGAFDEAAASPVEEESAGGELEKADLPDWIRSMAPKESEKPVTPAPAPAVAETDEDTLDWLNKLSGDSAFTSKEDIFSEEPKAAQPAGVPDWLSNFDKPAQESAASAAETSDWLSNFDKTVQESTEPAAETPDWFSKFDNQEQESAAPAAPAEPSEWQSELGGAAAVTASAAAASTADWLSKLDEETPSTPPAQEAAPAAFSAEAGIGDLGTSAAEQDAAMLWLESLAAKQGAKSEELITDPNARLETPPEWVEQAKAVGASQPAEPAPKAVELSPELAAFEPLLEPVPAEPMESVPPEMPLDQTGVWLRDLDEKTPPPQEPVKAEPATWSGEIEVVPPPTGPLAESATESDLPSWLRDLEKSEATPVSSPLDEMPDWLKGDEPEIPLVPEPTRAADWTPEAPKVTPRPAAPAPKAEAPKPEAPKVEAPKPEVRKPAARKPEPKPKSEAAPQVDRSKLRRTGMLPPLVDPNLASARDAMSHGKIPDALQAYTNLIRKGKLLEDVTFDLKEALYRFPVEVSIWQTLGDAYMRANRLQDALDAYTKAEELLR
ncbi:MAG: tetratricopeptide repeat protein, partial [Chloroflexota bacterium]